MLTFYHICQLYSILLKDVKIIHFPRSVKLGKKTFERYGGCCLEQLNEKYRDVDFLILMQNNLDIHSFHKPSIQLQGSIKQCNQIFSGIISKLWNFKFLTKTKNNLKCNRHVFCSVGIYNAAKICSFQKQIVL